MKRRFVIYADGDRFGEFQFCTSTQENYAKSVKAALSEITGMDDMTEDEMEEYGQPDTDYIIYEIRLVEVARKVGFLG